MFGFRRINLKTILNKNVADGPEFLKKIRVNVFLL